MKEIVFYEKENWEIPVQDFLDSLAVWDRRLKWKITHKIYLLSLGRLWYKDVKYVKDKIYELRIKDTFGISRVFYFNYSWNKIVLLDAIIKKENKLKQYVIDRVIKYKDNFTQKSWNI